MWVVLSDIANPESGWTEQCYFPVEGCDLLSRHSGDWVLRAEGHDWSPHPVHTEMGIGVPGLAKEDVRFRRWVLVSTFPFDSKLLPRESVLGLLHRQRRIRAGGKDSELADL